MIRKPRVWTPYRRLQLATALGLGLSYAKAARLLGVARGSVCWATARYGIGREAADLSRVTGRRRSDWSDEALTERWADRKRQAA